jgi:predicted dehydrogenase
MRTFAPYLLKHPERARLVAVADQDRARLGSAVEEMGASVRAYGDLDSMLQDPDVDAVFVTTPDYTHRQMVEQALDAGRHVLCEKPMATTMDDAVAVARKAAGSNKIVQIGFVLRHAPFIVKLKEMVEAEAVGPLMHAVVHEVVEYYHGASFFRRWHRFREKSGGLLVSKACHTLDVANWLVDASPAWVSATGGIDTFVPREGAAERCRDCKYEDTCPAAYRFEHHNYIYRSRRQREDRAGDPSDICVFNSDKDSVDNGALIARYENGVHLSFSFTVTGGRHDRRFLLVGREGHIEASQGDGTIAMWRPGADPEITTFGDQLRGEHGGGDAFMMESFFNCVASGEPPVAGTIAGLHSVLLGAAATISIDNAGRKVDLKPYLDQVG